MSTKGEPLYEWLETNAKFLKEECPNKYILPGTKNYLFFDTKIAEIEHLDAMTIHLYPLESFITQSYFWYFLLGVLHGSKRFINEYLKPIIIEEIGFQPKIFDEYKRLYIFYTSEN